MQQDLTPRQMEIFHLVAKGLSNREICELLGISANTVKIHVTSILRTLDVANRTEAVYAYREMLQKDDEQQTTRQLKLADRLGRPAIAVLPFTDLQSDKDDEHLLEGLVEELLVRLAAWQWFPVIAFASSSRFDNASDPQTVGAELNARYLVYGSVRRKDTRVRVTVRVVDTQLGQEVWSRTFNTHADDLFDLQDDVARQIVMTMAPELILAEMESQRSRHHASSSVWDLVCRGMGLVARRTRKSLAEASALFSEAIEADPEFSLAWHGRVFTLEVQIFEQWSEDVAGDIAALASSATQCHQLAPNAAHGLADMGLASLLVGETDVAKDQFRRALDLNPSSTRALSLLAQVCGMQGELDQCILYLEELLRLDPHSASAARYCAIIGHSHCMAGRYEESLRWSRDALARNPAATGAYLGLVAAYVELGQDDKAQATVSELRERFPDFVASARLAMMKPATTPELFDRLTRNLHKAGLTE